MNGPAPSRESFVEKVLRGLTVRGLSARVEVVSTPAHPSRVHVFARHPYGPEHGYTFDVVSEAWARSLAGNPILPSDVISEMRRTLRKRTLEP